MKRKLLSMVLVCVMVLSLCVTASAAGVSGIPAEPKDYGDPIRESTYLDEEIGAIVTERSYFVPDQTGITTFAKSGRGWYKNEKTFSWSGAPEGHETTTIYAKGYFVWGDGDVSVSSPSGGYDYMSPLATINKSKTTSGTGKYAGLFNKYAYVTYDLAFTNVVGIKKSYSVTIRVSESGNLI